MRLRKVTKNDLMLLFTWTNDPQVRMNSFNQNSVNIADHTQWLNIKLNSKNTLFYILEDNGISLGQIRLEIEEDKAIINYSIAPEYRGKGLGKVIITMAEHALLLERSHITQIVGFVKFENSISKNIFLSLGYCESVEIHENCYKFSKKLTI